MKQNALATQLASLNKQLAQKEQYALVLNDQEDKLKEVRKKYEDQFEKMETQMKSLEKEKDNLVQISRAEPVTSKLSEQRRRRIQDLESQIGDLKKKLIGNLIYFLSAIKEKLCCDKTINLISFRTTKNDKDQREKRAEIEDFG